MVVCIVPLGVPLVTWVCTPSWRCISLHVGLAWRLTRRSRAFQSPAARCLPQGASGHGDWRRSLLSSARRSSGVGTTSSSLIYPVGRDNDRGWDKGSMLKFDLGNPDPWNDGCSAYDSGLCSQIQRRCVGAVGKKANWVSSPMPGLKARLIDFHLRLASLISTTMQDVQRRRIDSCQSV